MSRPSAAVARRRRLALVYVPAFTAGALLCTETGTVLNGVWWLGALLMIAATGGVLLDLEPRMTEQPAGTVDQISPFVRRRLVQLPEPVSEQEWLGNDTPQGGDPEYASAFDAASDSLDAAGDALENGNLADAKHHALNLIGRISRLQALDRAS
jgi:hypothetical protein